MKIDVGLILLYCQLSMLIIGYTTPCYLLSMIALGICVGIPFWFKQEERDFKIQLKKGLD